MKLRLNCLPMLLLAFAPSAWALCLGCSCSVSATGVAFGAYNPLPGAEAVSTGTITSTCDTLLGVLSSYSISLGTGGSNSYSPRKMSGGGNTLNYNLYQDAAHTVVWGDGTSGTATYSDGSLLGLLGHSVRSYTVYGRILPGQQTARPGAYQDQIVVTVTYN